MRRQRLRQQLAFENTSKCTRVSRKATMLLVFLYIYITLVCVNDAVSSLVVFFVKQSNMVAQWKRQLLFYRWAMELGITS